MQLAKILLIEDEIDIAETIAHALVAYLAIRFEVRLAHDGEHGMALVKEFQPDVVILDLGLPGMSGSDVLAKLQQEFPQTKICILTAKSSLETKVATLQQGCDDYVVKPFALEELIARLIALLRRGRVIQENRLIGARLEVQIASCKVYRDSQEIKLTKTEFNLLTYLMRRMDQVVSRAELLEKVWLGKDLFLNTVDAHIESLRQKIDKPFGSKTIRTAYRQGYYFDSMT